jgi:hypothetical protein
LFGLFAKFIFSRKFYFWQSQFLAKVSVVVELAETQVLGVGVSQVMQIFNAKSGL